MSDKLDPVTLEVVRNALPAIANEMAADLQRTSYNMMIYEVRDFCTAIVMANGDLASQNVGGVSHFVADLGVIVTDALERFGIAPHVPVGNGPIRGNDSSTEARRRARAAEESPGSKDGAGRRGGEEP